MRRTNNLRNISGTILLCLAPCFLGCGGDAPQLGPSGTELGPSGTGTVEVAVTTTGQFTAPQSQYTVLLDQSEPRFIKTTGTLSLTEVAAGPHRVLLTDLPFGCVVEGSNPRDVEVAAEATVTIAFALTCDLTTGVEVSIYTHGELIGPGYSFLVDGNNLGPVQRMDQRLVGDLSPGAHSLGLSGLPSNCSMAGDNPRMVNLIPGQMSVFILDVNCVPIPPPPSGALLIFIHTVGIDPDGFEIVLDGGAPVQAPLDDYVLVGDIPIGVRSVLLSDLSEGRCIVIGENPRSVQVNIDASTIIDFEVRCEPFNT